GHLSLRPDTGSAIDAGPSAGVPVDQSSMGCGRGGPGAAVGWGRPVRRKILRDEACAGGGARRAAGARSAVRAGEGGSARATGSEPREDPRHSAVGPSGVEYASKASSGGTDGGCRGGALRI